MQRFKSARSAQRSRLFRRLFLAGLADAHAAGRLAFFGDLDNLCNPAAFAAHLAPLSRNCCRFTPPHPGAAANSR
jgi:hypothetical protein